MIEWIGFFISIIILLTISRINLGLSLILGGLTLGLFTLPITTMLSVIQKTLTDPSTLLLTLSVTLIPIIAGTLRISGQFDNIKENLRVGKKGFLGLSPALLGALPIPGGALFSAPLIEKAGGEISSEKKVGINLWFRHILYFIYPIAPALIISANIANISIYSAIKYLVPFFLLSIILGYFFFLRKVKGSINYEKSFDPKALLAPLSVLLIAPIVDLLLKNIFKFPFENLTLLIGILASLILAITFAKDVESTLKRSIKKMKPWNFTLIMIGIFIFISIFESSEIGGMIAQLSPPKIVFAIGFAFGLGFITGRINLPASILIPIIPSVFGTNSLQSFLFGVVYFSIFLGYVITPIHPCVSLSIEYFDANLNEFLKSMIPPVTTGIAVTVIIFLLIV